MFRAPETSRIGILDKAFAAGRQPSGLTENQRRRWRDLREHNRHDCTGMRSVAMLAAERIAISARRERGLDSEVDIIHVVPSAAEVASSLVVRDCSNRWQA
jgi:hypothetical protein